MHVIGNLAKDEMRNGRICNFIRIEYPRNFEKESNRGHQQDGVEMLAKVAYVGRSDDVASRDVDGKRTWLQPRWFCVVNRIVGAATPAVLSRS